MTKTPFLRLASFGISVLLSACAAWASEESIPSTTLAHDGAPKALDGARRFGLGFGAGYSTETGNAGLLYESRSPALDFRMAYWLDPRFAVQLSAQNSKHGYDVQPDGNTAVNLYRTLLQAKYYFDGTASPHLIVGSGMYWRTDTIGAGSATNDALKQSALGFNFGAGLEFRLDPSNVYLQVEAVGHAVNFSDDHDSKFVASGIPDRTGLWLVAQAALVYAW